jgi:hypothetical protein
VHLVDAPDFIFQPSTVFRFGKSIRETMAKMIEGGRLWSNLVREKIIFSTVKVSGATVEIMGTPYPHGMVIRLVIGDNLYIWNM